MSEPLDWTKPLMHRDGRRVALIQTLVDQPNGMTRLVRQEREANIYAALMYFKEDGVCFADPSRSLVNVPEGWR